MVENHSPEALKGKLKSSIKTHSIYPTFKAGNRVSEKQERKEFNKMIKVMIRKEDKRLLEYLWKARKQLLQHRMTYHVRMYDEKGRNVLTLVAYKFYYNHGQDIADYFEGHMISINYDDIGKIIKTFEEIMKSQGCGKIAYSVNMPSNQKEDVKIRSMTFTLSIN
jgi:hypothetical protein